MFQIEICPSQPFENFGSKNIIDDIKSIGIKTVNKVLHCPVYTFDGDLLLWQVEKIARELLSEPPFENFYISKDKRARHYKRLSLIEVWHKKGVEDGVAASVKKGLSDLSMPAQCDIKISHRYYLSGSPSQKELCNIAQKLFANALIQDYIIE
jgi:phosphoribosylformylglycinamidine (FGAM) synthase PurS component